MKAFLSGLGAVCTDSFDRARIALSVCAYCHCRGMSSAAPISLDQGRGGSGLVTDRQLTDQNTRACCRGCTGCQQLFQLFTVAWVVQVVSGCFSCLQLHGLYRLSAVVSVVYSCMGCRRLSST